MSYEVAIPSYRREQTLLAKTLPMLSRQGIDLGKVTVFVADEEQADTYAAALHRSPELEVRVVVAAPGIGPARNFIQRHYPMGTRLLSVDDDVSSVYEKDGEQGRREIEDLEAWLVGAFDIMARSGATLAGVHPVNNPFFLKHSITTDLRFVIGTFNLTRTTPLEWAQVTMSEKEDFEQTIKRFLKDGAVVRWNGVGLETKGRTEPGGLQTLGAAERKARNEASAQLLAATYPDLVTVFYRKNGLPEIRLKSPRI